MTVPTDRELSQRWRDEPAPLLPLLHAFHERDGFLSDEALLEISQALKIPIADLYGTITFYHHFSRREEGTHAPSDVGALRVCTGPVCRLFLLFRHLPCVTIPGSRDVLLDVVQLGRRVLVYGLVGRDRDAFGLGHPLLQLLA